MVYKVIFSLSTHSKIIYIKLKCKYYLKKIYKKTNFILNCKLEFDPSRKIVMIVKFKDEFQMLDYTH